MIFKARPVHGWFLRIAVAFLFAALVEISAAETNGSETESILRAPPPTWVEMMEWETPPKTGVAGAPAEILLYDQQDNLTGEGSDYFFRIVVRLLNTEGVRQNAEWSVVFAPDHEKITWHTIRLLRGSEVLDRLATAKFKQLQREPRLEAQVFDGRVSAVTVLDDIRVGDIIEVAYTRHTANPLLQGRLLATHFLGSGYPIRHERVLVRTPASEAEPYCSFLIPPGTLNLPDALFRPAKLRLALEKDEGPGVRIFRWEGRNLPAIVFDQAIPAQATPYYPMLQVASFRSWSEVASWGAAVFDSSATLPPPAHELVASWKKEYKSRQEQVAAAVHWVQDDVRYFAMAVGEHNLRPRPLADVWATRFGDCKEKALLLAQLLRALDIEAWPALVNSQLKERIREQAPTPFAFDHAILAYRLDGRLRWLDATCKNQQGPPGEWSIPNYRAALILRDGELDLATVEPPPKKQPDTETHDVITIDAETGDATLRVETVVRDLEADYYRQRLETTPVSELSNRWFNFLSRFYKKLEETEPVSPQDDPLTNQITIRATYRIPGFIHKESGAKVAVVYAYSLRALLDPPDSRRRHWPYALAADRWVRQRIELNSPYSLSTEELPEAIVSNGFEYRAEKGVFGKRFSAVHDLRFHNAYVAAEDMNAFCDAVDDLMTGLATSLRFPIDSAPPTKPVASQ